MSPNTTATTEDNFNGLERAEPCLALLTNRVFFYCVSLLLGFSALTKLWMLLTDPFADIRTGFPIWLTWLSVLIEIALAWFLATSFRPELKSSLVSLVFMTFFSFSLWQWAIGKDDCGCFGKLESHPSLSCAISGLVLLLNTFSARLIGKKLSWCFRILFDEVRALFGASKAILPGFLSGFAFIGFSVLLVMVYVVGEEAIVAEDIDLGRIEGTTEIKIQIRNRSEVDGRIIGFKSSCSCLAVLDHDLQIQGRESLSVRGIVRPTKEGRFHNRIVFFLDHSRQISTSVDVSGFFKQKGELK